MARGNSLTNVHLAVERKDEYVNEYLVPEVKPKPDEMKVKDNRRNLQVNNKTNKSYYNND